MKKQLQKIGIVVLMSISALVFNGCKGKDGATGPAGTDGNANVHSLIFTTTSASWAYTAPTYYVNLVDPQVTSDILGTGAVLVYVTGGGGSNTQLPYTYFPSTAYSETMAAVIALNQVQIQVTDSDLAAPNNPGALSFKVVTMSSRMMLTNPHVNFQDYESVKQAFHLKD